MTRAAPLRVTSLQAPHADAFCRRLCGHLAGELGRAVRFLDDEPWQLRRARLDDGDVDVAWICGLQYVLRRDAPGPDVHPLAAPVPAGGRYRGRPVYYSEVVVRGDARYEKLTDLRRARWAYNEPTSHSGHCVVRFELARAGLGSDFVGQAVEAGSHEAAIDSVLGGDADAAAIDTTVLDALREARPGLLEALRVIATWGPSPIPPWVAGPLPTAATRSALRKALTSMHRSAAGRAILAEGGTLRFDPVGDADYDPIRRMAHAARAVSL